MNDSEKGSSGEETEDETEEEKETEEEEEDGADRAWKFVVCEAAKDLKIFGLSNGTTAVQVLQSEELVQLLIKQMGAKILKWRMALEKLENECTVFAKLTKTKDRLVEQEDYDEDEATEKTFEERAGLLKEIVDTQEEFIQELFDKIDEKEENDEVDDTATLEN